MRRPRTFDVLNLAAVEFFAEFWNGGNAKLFIDALDALWVEARMVVDARDRRRGLRAQGFQFPKGAGPDDFTDGGGDGVADAGILRQVGIILDEFLEAFGHIAQLRGGALICFDLVRIFPLGR